MPLCLLLYYVRMTEPKRRPNAGILIDPDKLRYLRVRDGLSRLELAQLSGLSRDCIAKLENNCRRPRPSTLRKLCKALGCEPEALLYHRNRE